MVQKSRCRNGTSATWHDLTDQLAATVQRLKGRGFTKNQHEVGRFTGVLLLLERVLLCLDVAVAKWPAFMSSLVAIETELVAAQGISSAFELESTAGRDCACASRVC
jgi:hypothetical protein